MATKNPDFSSGNSKTKTVSIHAENRFGYIRPAPMPGEDLANKLRGPTYRGKTILAIVYQSDPGRYVVSYK